MFTSAQSRMVDAVFRVEHGVVKLTPIQSGKNGSFRPKMGRGALHL
jgi:hypothetical protein